MELTLSGFSRAEVLQYLGWRGNEIPLDVERQIEGCIQDTLHAARPRFTYRQFGLRRSENRLLLEGADIALPGNDIAALLEDCTTCVLFAATLGAPFEALIRRAGIRDMTQALILDCCGSSAIEAVCDQAEQAILQRLGGGHFTDRFSPGYGDMPITFQQDMVSLLDTPRQIGLTLTDSCILTPRKSVTAVLGLADRPQTKRFRGCAYCSMFENCTFRKAGKTCGR